jgi:hypothetical protein
MMEEKKSWLGNRIVVILALIFLFPLGLYLLWKSDRFPQWGDIGIGGKAWRFVWVGWTAGVFLMIVAASQEPQDMSDQIMKPQNTPASASAEKAALPIYGETINTGNFEVTMNGHKFSSRVDTGNPFTDIAPQEGNKYVILSATFKNISDRTRMPGSGAVYIEYNGKELKYNPTDLILLDGWGLFFEQMNPLTSTTTRLVFKIPADYSGPVYWEPERGKRFSLGSI